MRRSLCLLLAVVLVVGQLQLLWHSVEAIEFDMVKDAEERKLSTLYVNYKEDAALNKVFSFLSSEVAKLLKTCERMPSPCHHRRHTFSGLLCFSLLCLSLYREALLTNTNVLLYGVCLHVCLFE